MARLRNTERQRRQSPKDAAGWQHEWVRAGYIDAAVRRGFPDFYADATRDEQLHYELGRSWATNMLAAGILPPAWRNGPPPAEVSAANEQAAARGERYAFAWGRFPDTDDPVRLEPGSIPKGRRFWTRPRLPGLRRKHAFAMRER